jgi:glycosyltransferase involved in cell wall biosynthesis
MYPPTLGGVAGAARRLAGMLRDIGFTVHVVAVEEGAARPEGEFLSADEEGVVVHRIAQRAISNGTKFALRDVILALDARHAFDLFHGFFLPSAEPCLMAMEATRPGRPLVASIRGNDVITLKDHPFHRTAMLEVLRKADWVTSVNRCYLDLVAEDVPVAGRSSVIRNSVAQQPPDAPAWGLHRNNRGMVGMIGEFRKVKDVPLLVRAYAALPPDLRTGLLLAGFFTDPTEEEWTNALIDRFGLGGEVTRTGQFPASSAFEHLRALHVYVQCSAFEGMPNALIEAASLGVPLVATAVGGMAELLTDGETGLLVPHGDTAALSGAIRRILEDDALARKLGAGSRRLGAQLAPEVERSEWRALYGRLLACSG